MNADLLTFIQQVPELLFGLVKFYLQQKAHSTAVVSPLSMILNTVRRAAKKNFCMLFQLALMPVDRSGCGAVLSK